MSQKYQYSTYLFLLLNCLFLFQNTVSGQDKNDMLYIADSLFSKDEYADALKVYETYLIDNEDKIDDQELTRISGQIGHCYCYLGKEGEAIEYYHKIINKSTSLDSFLLSDIYSGLGICYEYTGRHDSAFINYFKAYSMIRESEDTMRMARGLRDMAQLLRVMKRYDQARYYCNQAIELASGIRDYKVLANIYNETAYLYELSNKLDSARIFYQKLIDISQDNDFIRGVSVGSSNLASVYERQHSYAKALELKLYALELDKQIGNQHGLMTSYAGLKEPYLELGDYNRALQALLKAKSLCDTSWITDLSGIYLGLYETYKLLGQAEKALEAFETYSALDKRIKKVETEERVQEIFTRYETEKKEQQIRILEQANLAKRNQILFQWVLISALILVAIASLIVFFLILRNKNHKLVQMETELRNFQLLENKVLRKDDPSQEDGEEKGKNNHELTSREGEILDLLGRGYSNAAIAEKLFISRNTVKYHIKNIYIKLDVKNRVEALMRSNNIL